MIIIAIMVAAVFLSFFMGRFSISPAQVFALAKEKIFGIDSGFSQSVKNVFFNIRLPRVIGAFLIGAALSLSGTVYQATFKNPMVSPDVLGATAGAGLGAAIGLMLDVSDVMVQAMSFGTGLLAVGITCMIGTAVGNKKNMTLTLVLTGMVVQAMFSAVISLVKYVADPYSKLPAITFWLMGSVSSVTFKNLHLILIPFLLGSIPLFFLRWKINLLSLSDEESLSMGVNVSALRAVVIVCATLMTSAVVSISGMIGWVGLIIPHVARMIIGPNTKIQLPVSILIGGTYLLLIDDLARSWMAMEIPIGILTALIGAPFFVFLIYRYKKGGR
ncbi:MAG: iron ABC transporter permease [Dehalococcoidales bacterium]|nr:iron ABC transporter permease [Dehalococcoidales bacterium]